MATAPLLLLICAVAPRVDVAVVQAQRAMPVQNIAAAAVVVSKATAPESSCKADVVEPAVRVTRPARLVVAVVPAPLPVAEVAPALSERREPGEPRGPPQA